MSKSKLLEDGMLVDMQGITLVISSGYYVTRNCRDVCGFYESSKPRCLWCMERIRGKKEFLKKYDGETSFKTLVL